MADVQRLITQLDLRGDFNKGMRDAQKNLRGFSDQTNRAQGRFSRFRSTLRSPELKSGLLQGVGLSGGLIGFQLLSGAIGKTVDIFGDAVRMAAEEEAAIAQLTKAVDKNVDAWDGNIAAIERRINANQRLAFSDGEQREALRLLVAQTHDVDEAFRLLGTSMDFARFRGIDLKTSADLLGRAFAGNFQTLSRYGVVLKEGADATEAIAQIQKLANGQARAYANTTQGKLVRAQIALDDAMEDLGRTLTPVVADLGELAAETIPEIVKAFQDAAKDAEPFIRALQDVQGGIEDIVDAVPPEARDIFDDVFGGLGPVPNALLAVQGGLQEVQRATIGVNEDTETLNQSMAFTLEGAEKLGAGLKETGQQARTSSAFILAGAEKMGGGFADARKEIRAFRRELSGEAAETRSLGAINKELEKQKGIRAKAAREDRVRAFFKADAAVKELNQEKALRAQAREALASFKEGRRQRGEALKIEKQRTKETRKALETLNKTSLEDIRKELEKSATKAEELGDTDPTVHVRVAGNAAALRELERLRLAAASVGKTVTVDITAGGTPPTGPRGFHSGGTLRAGHTGVVKSDEALLTPASDMRIEPLGKRDTPIVISPTLLIAATQVEDNTSRVVRTTRYRAKN